MEGRHVETNIHLGLNEGHSQESRGREACGTSFRVLSDSGSGLSSVLCAHCENLSKDPVLQDRAGEVRPGFTLWTPDPRACVLFFFLNYIS